MWKTAAVLVICAGALVHAQTNTFPSRGQTTYQRNQPGQYQQGQYQQNQYQQGQYQQGQYQQGQYQQGQYQQNQNQYQQNQNQYQQNQYQQNQNQYQQNQYNQNQYQQTPAPRVSSGVCHEANARYPVSGSCDKYIECINGTSEEKLCPDGLRYNPDVKFNVYPCQYPNEVACAEGRSTLQPAQATDACPHQFGYYKLGDARNCSGFRNCVSGVGYDFTCPEGLAFSSETYRCEWPDQVADCDAEAFLGFRCPEIPISKELGPPVGYRFYRSDVNCQKYFLCIDGRPRALTCGGDSAFDDLTSTCVSADEVDVCPQELRTRAAVNREEQQQRLAKEIQFNSRPHPQKRRF